MQFTYFMVVAVHSIQDGERNKFYVVNKQYCLWIFKITQTLDYNPRRPEIVASTIPWPNATSMLGLRRRRWPNIEPILLQCIVMNAMSVSIHDIVHIIV